jgi:hypothetical protein
MKLYTVTIRILFLFLLLLDFSAAQEVPLDTVRIPSGDSVLVITPEMLQPKPKELDTLPFEKYNFYDSLFFRALPERLNLRPEAERSFLHDAGDFLKFSPSYLILEDHQTPTRKTATPFNLPGDRLNLILDGNALSPVEHLLEPDAQVDLNDIPDAAVGLAYNIEGPLGLAFGGANATSSLILASPRPKGTEAISHLVVDKGSFGYSNTIAQFASRSRNGRILKGAVEYRKGDGAYLFRDDDAYHQWGKIKQPLGKRLTLNLNGRLYRREGNYSIRPDTIFYYMARDRRDRDFSGGFEYYHAGNATSGLEIQNQKSESRPSNAVTQYKRALKLENNNIRLFHQYRFSTIDALAEIMAGREEFDELGVNRKRNISKASLTLSGGDSSAAFTVFGTVAKAGGFDPAPARMLSYLINRGRLLLNISAAYTTRYPGQYLLDLPFRREKLYDLNLYDYYEAGNPNLKMEKQMVGHITLGIGRENNDILLSATGGKIIDGIDWLAGDTLLGAFYRPGNHDIEFINATLTKSFALRDNIFWTGGGSYHYLKVADNDDPPYSPDYQLFSSLELSYQFRKPSIRLYSYIEGQYYGPFEGPHRFKMGQKPLLNVKFSFSIKSFRFYYIFQNIIGAEYQLRENTTIPSWYDYFGFSWDFLD